MDALKSISFSDVQNMIEIMILTSYSDESYFVAMWDGYIASFQLMSGEKLKHQVRWRYLSYDTFTLSHDITFMLHWRLRYTMTADQISKSSQTDGKSWVARRYSLAQRNRPGYLSLV